MKNVAGASPSRPRFQEEVATAGAECGNVSSIVLRKLQRIEKQDVAYSCEFCGWRHLKLFKLKLMSCFRDEKCFREKDVRASQLS